MAVSLADGIGEAMAYGDADGLSGDRAGKDALLTGMDERERWRLEKAARDAAATILRRGWRAVVAVARELEAMKPLRHKQIVAAMG